MKVFFTLFLLYTLLSSILYAQYNFYPINLQSNTFQSDFEKQPTMSTDVENIDSKKLKPKYEKIVKELVYMQVLAMASIGVIALLPEGVSQWSAEDKVLVDTQKLLAKHADNIAKGAVLDNDSLAINYIGHPVVGSYFYVWGRQSGLTWQESTILTTLMSTFYWEYGWEAFAEAPSIQDLIVTPILGSLLGESTNYLYSRLMENEGKIYNSTFIGGIGRGLLNPIGEINKIFDDAFEAADIEISIDYSYAQNSDNYKLRNIVENNRQIQSYFNFNFKLKY